MGNENKRIVELDKWGCAVSVDDGVLLTAPKMADGSIDEENWGEVIAPISAEFVEVVNGVFNTSFKFSDWD
jgi:hypothetical protein